jgi:hypothetical protein
VELEREAVLEYVPVRFRELHVVDEKMTPKGLSETKREAVFPMKSPHAVKRRLS